MEDCQDSMYPRLWDVDIGFKSRPSLKLSPWCFACKAMQQCLCGPSEWWTFWWRTICQHWLLMDVKNPMMSFLKSGHVIAGTLEQIRSSWHSHLSIPWWSGDLYRIASSLETLHTGCPTQETLVQEEAIWHIMPALHQPQYRHPSKYKLHYVAKNMWTPAHSISHSKIMGINIELVSPLLL